MDAEDDPQQLGIDCPCTHIEQWEVSDASIGSRSLRFDLEDISLLEDSPFLVPEAALPGNWSKAQAMLRAGVSLPRLFSNSAMQTSCRVIKGVGARADSGDGVAKAGMEIDHAIADGGQQLAGREQQGPTRGEKMGAAWRSEAELFTTAEATQQAEDAGMALAVVRAMLPATPFAEPFGDGSRTMRLPGRGGASRRGCGSSSDHGDCLKAKEAVMLEDGGGSPSSERVAPLVEAAVGSSPAVEEPKPLPQLQQQHAGAKPQQLLPLAVTMPVLVQVRRPVAVRSILTPTRPAGSTAAEAEVSPGMRKTSSRLLRWLSSSRAAVGGKLAAGAAGAGSLWGLAAMPRKQQVSHGQSWDAHSGAAAAHTCT